MTPSEAQRVPLAELPLSAFARDPNLPLSPVSLPLKRPATPGTPKAVAVALDEDELGTGRSPARRLFDATPRAIPSKDVGGGSGNGKGKGRAGPGDAPREMDTGAESSASASASARSRAREATAQRRGTKRTAGGTLAPSPPLTRRAAALSASSASSSASGFASAPSSSSRSSASTTPTSTPTPPVHDPGFVVFADDDAARTAPPPRTPFVPVSDADEENVPPVPDCATPRRKRFEPSKLSATVTASPDPSPPIRSGKQGMIAEADADAAGV